MAFLFLQQETYWIRLEKINKERYVIFNRRTYKLGNAEYFGSGSGTSSTVGRQYYTNNDFKLTQRATFDYTKHLIKTVKYSNDGDTTPLNKATLDVVDNDTNDWANNRRCTTSNA